jgi:hypothetical protein
VKGQLLDQIGSLLRYAIFSLSRREWGGYKVQDPRGNMTRKTALAALILLTACAQDQSNVKITSESGVDAVQAQSRSEPIFYNGKMYQLDLAPVGAGAFQLVVGGMAKSQQKDATAVATSSLRYYACQDGQVGVLTVKPVFQGGKWRMTARCA